MTEEQPEEHTNGLRVDWIKIKMTASIASLLCEENKKHLRHMELVKTCLFSTSHPQTVLGHLIRRES